MQVAPFVEADFSIANGWVDVINDVLYRVRNGVDALGSMLSP